MTDRDPLPRWVKMTFLVLVILAVALTLLLLTGQHGPGRHSSSAEIGVSTPTSANRALS